MYDSTLLDLYKNPLNKKKLSDFDVERREHNPLCGDVIELFIKWKQDGTLQTIGWQGDGCVISQTAASLLTEHIKDTPRTDWAKLSGEDIIALLGLEKLNPTRLRCATLALETLKKCL